MDSPSSAGDMSLIQSSLHPLEQCRIGNGDDYNRGKGTSVSRTGSSPLYNWLYVAQDVQDAHVIMWLRATGVMEEAVQKDCLAPTQDLLGGGLSRHYTLAVLP